MCDFAIDEPDELDCVTGNEDKDDMFGVAGVKLVGVEFGTVWKVELSCVDGCPVYIRRWWWSSWDFSVNGVGGMCERRGGG